MRTGTWEWQSEFIEFESNTAPYTVYSRQSSLVRGIAVSADLLPVHSVRSVAMKRTVFTLVLLLSIIHISCLRPSKHLLRKLREEEQRMDPASSTPSNVLIPQPDGDDVASSGVEDSAETCQAVLDTGLLRLQNVYENCLGEVPFYVKDCCQLNYLGFRHRSGIYGVRNELAYCDMETDGGGWLVIVRRVPKYKPDGPSRSFRKNWKQYERGFGILDRNFWLGLRRMHQLTSAQPMELRVDFTRTNGTKAFVYYENFYVAGPKDKYRVTIEGFNPNISTVSDALSGHNGAQFSTYDQDNDGGAADCSNDPYSGAWGGGWWFGGAARRCFSAMFTTRYYHDLLQRKFYGIYWLTFGTSSRVSPTFTVEDFSHAEMKVRPKAWHCGSMYRKKVVNGNVPLY